jgi:hypothetical protein
LLPLLLRFPGPCVPRCSYLAYEQEFWRTSNSPANTNLTARFQQIDSFVDDKTVHELYLPGFAEAVRAVRTRLYVSFTLCSRLLADLGCYTLLYGVGNVSRHVVLQQYQWHPCEPERSYPQHAPQGRAQLPRLRHLGLGRNVSRSSCLFSTHSSSLARGRFAYRSRLLFCCLPCSRSWGTEEDAAAGLDMTMPGTNLPSLYSPHHLLKSSFSSLV